jgi:hypothetical protein
LVYAVLPIEVEVNPPCKIDVIHLVRRNGSTDT